MTKTKNKTIMICMCAVFAALIAVGAFIRIPIPYINITLQVFFVALAGLLLGGKYGALSVCVYVFLGLIGIPIFTEGGGFFYVLKPTFGYLVGFAVGAYVMGKIANAVPNPSLKRLFAADTAGILIIYAVGVVYFYIASNLWVGEGGISVGACLLYCFVLLFPKDFVVSIIAIFLAKRLIPVLRKYQNEYGAN